jgi:hypothetical protein
MRGGGGRARESAQTSRTAVEAPQESRLRFLAPRLRGWPERGGPHACNAATTRDTTTTVATTITTEDSGDTALLSCAHLLLMSWG